MELYYIVYITINLCNGKFYIGVHKTNPEVFDGYIGNSIYRQADATKDLPFHKAVRKYGYENFKRTTLVKFPNTEKGRLDAFALEGVLVNEDLLRSKNTYNVALGGLGSIGLEERKTVYMFDLDGNYLRSFDCVRDAARYINPENEYDTLKSIRNNCLKTSKSSFGYYWSYEKKFEKHVNECFRKVAQYTIGGKFLKYYDSMADAEREFGISNIEQAIRTKGSSGGFQWRYYEGDTSDITPLLSTFTKNKYFPIVMYDKKGNKIEEYSSVNECVEKNPELKTSQINRVLSNVIKSHKGFVFKYKQDEDIV